MNRTALTTSAGAMVDLLEPQKADIDFGVIAEHLAKINRYCGATRDLTYSVAEHSVRCADAAIVVGDPQLAAYLLIHDAHEAYLGDDTTPKKKALQAIMTEFGSLADAVESSFARMAYRLDVAIHARAGLDFPLGPTLQKLVHHVDRVLLATEWRDRMRCAAPYDFGVEPLTETIVPLPWRAARILFQQRCGQLLPGLMRVPA